MSLTVQKSVLSHPVIVSSSEWVYVHNSPEINWSAHTHIHTHTPQPLALIHTLLVTMEIRPMLG